MDRQEKISLGSALFGIQCQATSDDHMNMRVKLEVLSPGVQYRSDTSLKKAQ